MPIYEYECLECKERFERKQSINDEPIKQCVNCGGTARRVLHPVGIIFKGSGFYATDHRKPHYGDGAKTPTESKGEAKSEKSGSDNGKADSKPAKEEVKTGA